eukprot:tig00021717_g23144.t1
MLGGLFGGGGNSSYGAPSSGGGLTGILGSALSHRANSLMAAAPTPATAPSARRRAGAGLPPAPQYGAAPAGASGFGAQGPVDEEAPLFGEEGRRRGVRGVPEYKDEAAKQKGMLAMPEPWEAARPARPAPPRPGAPQRPRGAQIQALSLLPRGWRGGLGRWRRRRRYPHMRRNAQMNERLVVVGDWRTGVSRSPPSGRSTSRHITATFDPVLPRPTQRSPPPSGLTPLPCTPADDPAAVPAGGRAGRGEELVVFHMGSTVVLVSSPHDFEFALAPASASASARPSAASAAPAPPAPRSAPSPA